MPDMMAIVSKAVFEKDHPGAKPGATLPIDVYRSTHKAFEKLKTGGRLFLVTARPDDVLWLVAVLDGLTFDGKQWNSKPNRTPITDITALKGSITFDSGKGITAAPGQLGMSLQTPRVLTSADAQLLGGSGAETTGAPTNTTRNLTAHEPVTALPCLCSKCIAKAPERATAKDMSFFRMSAEAHGRTLHFWVPDELAETKRAVQQSVAGAMRVKLKNSPVSP
ncbi:MAG: hypothetical protein JNM69_38945 [Archangium sp.]|nr:hypothetical protein [Archangium sp.]